MAILCHKRGSSHMTKGSWGTTSNVADKSGTLVRNPAVPTNWCICCGFNLVLVKNF